ncbi:hypothetical protein RLOatenuis_3550 [Rickettsiales bacterium]|nr:hypothetical protein RLOatenuis_3550 [Rickettsiales bacterium]
MNDSKNGAAPDTTRHPFLANMSAALFKFITNSALRLDVDPRRLLAEVLIKTYEASAKEVPEQVCIYLEETISNAVLEELSKETAETEESTPLLKSKL